MEMETRLLCTLCFKPLLLGQHKRDLCSLCQQMIGEQPMKSLLATVEHYCELIASAKVSDHYKDLINLKARPIVKAINGEQLFF